MACDNSEIIRVRMGPFSLGFPSPMPTGFNRNQNIVIIPDNPNPTAPDSSVESDHSERRKWLKHFLVTILATRILLNL